MSVEAVFPRVIGACKEESAPSEVAIWARGGELFSIVVSDCFDAVSERQKHACAGLRRQSSRSLSGSSASLVYLEVRSDVRHDNAFARLAPIIASASRVSDTGFSRRQEAAESMSTRFGISPRPEFLPLRLSVFFAAVTQVNSTARPRFSVLSSTLLIDALVTDEGDADPSPQTPADLTDSIRSCVSSSSISSRPKSGAHFARLSEASSRLCAGLPRGALLEAIAVRAGCCEQARGSSSTDRWQLPRACGLASGRFARARKSGSVVRRVRWR